MDEIWPGTCDMFEAWSAVAGQHLNSSAHRIVMEKDWAEQLFFGASPGSMAEGHL